jgi:hypothetical protein
VDYPNYLEMIEEKRFQREKRRATGPLNSPDEQRLIEVPVTSVVKIIAARGFRKIFAEPARLFPMYPYIELIADCAPNDASYH